MGAVAVAVDVQVSGRVARGARTVRAAAACVAVAWLALAPGCGAHRAPAGPAEALEAFRRALERGDLDAAYALMSDEYRGTTGRAEFERYLRSDPERVPTLLANLRAARPGDAAVTATVPLGVLSEAKLVRGADGAWLLDEGAIKLYDQSTPREALRSFVRALERRRWEVLLRFIPDRYREHMTAAELQAELEKDPDKLPRLVAALKESIDNEIVISVDRRTAKMRYGMYEVDFVKEGDLWKIEDPD
jgi:hypothetical protein